LRGEHFLGAFLPAKVAKVKRKAHSALERPAKQNTSAKIRKCGFLRQKPGYPLQ
jgi:hypothetical protein